MDNSPPREVYSPFIRSIDSMNGVDVNISFMAHGGNVELGLIIGSKTGKTTTADTEADLLTGLKINFSDNYLASRYSYLRIRANRITEGHRTLIFPLERSLVNIREHDWIHYHAVGLSYIIRDWQFDAGVNLIQSRKHNVSPEIVGSYVSASRTINSLEFFTLFGYQYVSINGAIGAGSGNIQNIIDLDTTPVGSNGINGSLSPINEVSLKTISTGFRWDINDKFTFKYNLRYTQDYDDILPHSPTLDIVLNRVTIDMVF
jgi:hypothetical protein